MSYNDTIDLGQEGGGEEVQEDGGLTLVAWVGLTATEGDHGGRNSLRTARLAADRHERPSTINWNLRPPSLFNRWWR